MTDILGESSAEARLALHAEGWRADVAETGARVGTPGSMAGGTTCQNVSACVRGHPGNMT